MSRYEIHEITDQRYELVDSLPDGKLVRVIERPGTAIVQFVRAQARPTLMDYMTGMVQDVLDQKLWVQVWVPGEPRLDGPIEGLGIAKARWELTPPGIKLPDPAHAFEKDGEFIFLIEDGEAQPAAVAQYNQILTRIASDGLWQQNWESTEGSAIELNSFMPGASLDPFALPIVRAEWVRDPEEAYLQIRQYTGHFDVGENLLFVHGLSRDFDRALCVAHIRGAGWAIAGPWTKSDRGGLEVPVRPL